VPARRGDAGVRPGRFKIVASGMRHCQAARERGDQPPITEDELKKLFLSLA